MTLRDLDDSCTNDVTTTMNDAFLDILRCPLDPEQTKLQKDETCLRCERCELRFPIRDGFPSLLVDEAELPPDCKSLEQLPCQREAEE